jgi:hypothetical protein
MGKKNKKQFFAKHAKSSAALVSLGIHAVLILIALTFVAVTVITKEEKVFVAKETNRPKMKLKKLQVPIKMTKKKKTTAKLRKRVVAKKTRRTTMNIALPEITGTIGGMGGMDGGGGIGTDIGFTMPEINFFGVKKKSEKVVFIVLAGPASTSGANGRFTPKSRMCFHTLNARLNDMVQDLPEYALFNAAFFQMQLTTPFSTNMLLATQKNKDRLGEWSKPVNPLFLENTYAEGGLYEGFWERFKALDWYAGDVMTNNVPPVYPKWVYHYTPGAHIMKHYVLGERDEREFIHVNRAICFALEQKPDTIFILTTNYIGVDSSVNAQTYLKICRDVYGPDARKYPSINVVIMGRSGQDSLNLGNVLDTYGPIINQFRGKGEIVEDIRDHMTLEEREAMEELPGVF